METADVSYIEQNKCYKHVRTIPNSSYSKEMRKEIPDSRRTADVSH